MTKLDRYVIDRSSLLQKTYNLLCLFFANKEIARRSNPQDPNAPLSSLERMFLAQESSRLLIEIAVLVRIIDDQMRKMDEKDPERQRYYAVKKRVDEYTYGMFDDLNLDLRETCNKIIHSDVMETHTREGSEAHEDDFVYAEGYGERTIEWHHFNGYIRLCGRKGDKKWYVLLDVEVFVSAVYELFCGNGTGSIVPT